MRLWRSSQGVLLTIGRTTTFTIFDYVTNAITAPIAIGWWLLAIPWTDVGVLRFELITYTISTGRAHATSGTTTSRRPHHATWPRLQFRRLDSCSDRSHLIAFEWHHWSRQKMSAPTSTSRHSQVPARNLGGRKTWLGLVRHTAESIGLWIESWQPSLSGRRHRSIRQEFGDTAQGRQLVE